MWAGVGIQVLSSTSSNTYLPLAMCGVRLDVIEGWLKVNSQESRILLIVILFLGEP